MCASEEEFEIARSDLRQLDANIRGSLDRSCIRVPSTVFSLPAR